MSGGTLSPRPAIKFVEFIGLPGAGKTTIATHLEKILREHGFRIVSRSAALADRMPFVLRQFKRSLIVARTLHKCWHLDILALRIILASGQDSLKDLCKVTWNICSVAAFMANSRRADIDVAVVDQGLLQAIWSIRLRSSKALYRELCAQLLLSAGLRDVLFIFVQSEIPVARNRLSGRTAKETRLQSRPRDDIDGPWEVAAAEMKSLIEFLGEIASLDNTENQLVTVNNSFKSPETAAAEVTSAFLAQSSSRKVDHSFAHQLDISR